MKENQPVKVAFIVGSPRSGTTLLGSILDIHPRIARWHEPYFIFDHFFRGAPHDALTPAEVTPQVKQYLVKAVQDFGRKQGCDWVVLKSPRNSLKIAFMQAVFPDARYIHIVRDGRDTVLSIREKWALRAQQFGTRKGPGWLQALKTTWRFASRQPVWSHKLQAIRFETGGLGALLRRDPLLNKIRWEGRTGWGPRFQGWQELIDQVPLLAFNAYQWIRCIQAIEQATVDFTPEQFTTIRYETLLQAPEQSIQTLLNFLGLMRSLDFDQQMPVLNRSNFGKWKAAFTQEELLQIGPVLSTTLLHLGYESDPDWYRLTEEAKG